MNSTPCYDCENRFLGCHGTCKKYKKYRSRLDKIAEIKANKRQSEEYLGFAVERMKGSGRGLY